MSRWALARSGQNFLPTSALTAGKNGSAAAPSRLDPVRLVLCQVSRHQACCELSLVDELRAVRNPVIGSNTLVLPPVA